MDKVLDKLDAIEKKDYNGELDKPDYEVIPFRYCADGFHVMHEDKKKCAIVFLDLQRCSNHRGESHCEHMQAAIDYKNELAEEMELDAKLQGIMEKQRGCKE
jgi:hypothetical protein